MNDKEPVIMSSYSPEPGSGLPPLPSPGAAPSSGPGSTYVRLPKSPGIAVLLSLFPGVGQIYNGQPAKAFVFFFAIVGSIYGAAEIHPFPFAFLIPFTYIYNLVDAHKSANAINARFVGGDRKSEEIDTVESPAWGAGLVVLGVVLLLNNLGWIRLENLQRFWPLLLIAAGAAFLRGSLRKRRDAGSFDEPRL